MKGISSGGGASDLCKSATLIKISGFVLISVIFFYLGKHFSDGSSQQLIFFSSHQNPEPQTTQSSAAVGLSPNLNKTFDISSLVNDTASSPPPENSRNEPQQVLTPPPPPPPPALKRMGVVDENGRMTDDFEVGEYDPELVENWAKTNESEGLESDGKGDRVRVKKFPLCPESMREYIPCLDNEEAIKKLNSTEKGEKFERHCPEEGKGLNCLVPAPKGYRSPIPWPRSRDEVTFALLVCN